MYGINPGKYRQRIEIQEQVTSKDSGGLVSVSWETYQIDSNNIMSSVPAQVLLGPGREPIVAGSKHSAIDARISFRYFPGLTQKMRIIWDGRIFEISSLEADETGRLEWRCKCTEGVSTGR